MSALGTATPTAPASPSADTHALIVAGRTSGRAASCSRTRSVSAARPAAARAAREVSVRVAPPGSTAPTLVNPAAATMSPTRPRYSSTMSTTISSTSGHASNAAIVCSMTGRPARVMSCLGEEAPIRAPTPPARTAAITRGRVALSLPSSTAPYPSSVATSAEASGTPGSAVPRAVPRVTGESGGVTPGEGAKPHNRDGWDGATRRSRR